MRRLYLFIVSVIGLFMLLGGLLILLGTLVDLSFDAAVFGPSMRDSIATSTAVATVGLAGWLLHWTAVQRQAGRDPGERASPLRRLYLYGTAFVLMMALGVIASALCEKLLSGADGTPIDRVGAASDFLRMLLIGIFWRYHLRVVEADRDAVGEVGASATLRRWYTYGIQFIALTAALFATRDLIGLLVGLPGRVGRVPVAGDSARALVWLGIWIWHVGRTDRRSPVESDRGSTLRAVEAFLVLALAVALVLVEANRTLYYLVARALGVEAPGGVRVFDFATVARPLATVLVFGSAWALIRHRLARDAAASEPIRQAAVRRLYEHLVAWVAVFALATGLSGLLWNLLDLVFGATRTQPGRAADQISLFLALVLVAAPVWLLHWRASPGDEERKALSRRLYLFVTLAACVVALLVSGAGLIASIFNAVLAGDVASLPTRMSGPLSIVAVAGIVGGYHWRILRRDAQERAIVEPGVEVQANLPPTLVVKVVGATAEDVRIALSSLPEGSSYSIDLGSF